MLNREDLKEIFKITFPEIFIKDIHWLSQNSMSDSILFYKIADDQKSEETFRERIKTANFALLVVNKSIPNLLPNSIVIEESKWPGIQYEILNRLYPLPELKFIGVTGTNGKTTTTDLVLQIGHLIGKNGISIGTLGVREYNKTILDFGLTSPGQIDLRKFLFLYGKGKDFCVMEASSHALEQDRLHGISFDVAGWLSFTQDHLDYHATMDKYYKAKALIFKKLKPKAKLFVPVEQKELFKKLSQTSNRVHVGKEIQDSLPIFFSTQFNKNNLEVAYSIIHEVFDLHFKINYQNLLPPDGRFYIQPYLSNFIIVDFAHTPDALDNICRGIKSTFPGYKLKVLFGCGGDRDRKKRPLMASVVCDWADEVYITSDNPRNEDPLQIISDILKGIKGKKFQVIPERPKAVKVAFSELKDQEVLLLAGKGHEDYILTHGAKYPYSDIREVDEFISRNKNG